jgi:hypothetical protein
MSQFAAAAFLVLWILAIGWQANNLWRAYRNWRRAKLRQ